MSHLPIRLAIAILLSSAIATAQPPAQSISVTPQCITLKNGETTHLTATVLPPEASQSVKWEADYSGEYTIDDNGNITATYTSDNMQSGLMVSATTTDGTNLTAHCSIAKEYSVPESIEILQPEITIHQGETAEITARLLPEDGLYESIRWYSGNRLLGHGNTLSYKGINTWDHLVITAEYSITEEKVEITEEGEEIIEISQKNLTAECIVNIIDPLATTMSIYPTRLRLPAGTSVQLSATAYPDFLHHKYQWKSDNPGVVTVDENGMISTVADGKANVTATAMDGSEINRTCEITVMTNKEERHPNTLLISTKNGTEHSIPLSDIEQIVTITNSAHLLQVSTHNYDKITIPLADITAISHIYDSNNGVASLTDSTPSIAVYGSRLVIEGCTDTPLTEIYDLTGQRIYSDHTSSVELDKGIYIVIINNTTVFKIKI